MRWTMLPPIRPRPTKPICIGSEPLDADDGQAVVLERLQVARGLRGDELRELAVAPVPHDLDEDALRRAALVELAGRVQEPRPVAERGRHAVVLVADALARPG